MANYQSAYTGAQIDDAVSKAHQHSNKEVLDNITASYTEAEKTKLAGLNNYTLPVATSNTLGGVKAGENVTVTEDGTLNATGAVDSVNGKTGVINLSASDVGALPNTTTIPSKTSDLQNDSGYLVNAENTNIQVLKIWVGTQAQYDAITTKENNTEYNITEE